MRGVQDAAPPSLFGLLSHVLLPSRDRAIPTRSPPPRCGRGALDDDLRSFLVSIEAHLRRDSALFLLSDHGSHGIWYNDFAVGQAEHRTPALFLVLPASFVAANPSIDATLRRNSRWCRAASRRVRLPFFGTPAPSPAVHLRPPFPQPAPPPNPQATRNGLRPPRDPTPPRHVAGDAAAR